MRNSLILAGLPKRVLRISDAQEFIVHCGIRCKKSNTKLDYLVIYSRETGEEFEVVPIGNGMYKNQDMIFQEV